MNPIRGLFFIEFADSFTGGPQVLVNFLATADRARLAPLVLTNCESRLTEELARIDVPFQILELPVGAESRKGEALQEGFGGKLKLRKRCLDYNRKVSQIIEQNNIDFLWARNVKGVLLTGYAARAAGVPLFWDIGMEKQSKGFVALLHFLAFRLSHRVVAEARVVFNQVFPSWMKRIYSKTLTVNLSGIAPARIADIETERQQAALQPDKIRVLNVASINPRKNQAMLLEAVRLADLPNLEVKIAGPVTDEPYHEDLVELMATHDIKNIEFLGWRDDIPKLLGGADLFVICSNNEGVPYSVLEAMHARVAIVATKAGGIPDVIDSGKTGILLEIDDAKGLAGVFREYAARPEKYSEIAEAAKRYVVENHQLKSWCERYLDMIEQAVKHR